MGILKSILLVSLFIACAPVSLSAQSVRNDSLNKNDAVILCLRVQTEGIFLDSTLLSSISFALEKARSTRDTLNTIHAFPQYVSGQILLSSSGAWTDKWKKGLLMTEYEPVDSLLRRYNIRTVEVHSSFYLLQFAQPVHAENLATLFELDSTIRFAEPNYYGGDWHNIEFIQKNGEWGFAFSHGSGDCPAGCTIRYYWYVSVRDSQALCLDSMYMSSSGTKIYPWMIPDGVRLKAYVSLDQIIDAAKNEPVWWKRKHAVRSLPALFAYMHPNTPAAVLQMANAAKLRRQELFTVLQEKTNDPDPDVSRSAIFALGMIIADYENYAAYYPLKNGNELYYKNIHPYDEETLSHWKVLKDTVVGYRDQNKIVDDQVMFGRKMILYTTVSHGTVRYLDSSQNYQILFDFSADVGAQWNVPFPDRKYRVVMVSKNDTIASFRHCYRFDVVDRAAGDRVVRTVWMAPGYGIVATNSFEKEVPSLIITDASRLAGISPVTSTPFLSVHSPVSHALFQNYPNPFNPLTTIQFTIGTHHFTDQETGQKVKLEIFDLLGRTVTTLLDEFRMPGVYSVQWNAADQPTGVFFMRLSIGSFSRIKKMIVLN